MFDNEIQQRNCNTAEKYNRVRRKGVLGAQDILHATPKEYFTERLITWAKCPEEMSNHTRQEPASEYKGHKV